MPHIISRRALLLTGTAFVAGAAALPARAQHRLRKHTATRAKNISLGSANRNPGTNQVSITQSGSKRLIRSNGIPNHKIGSFRFAIKAQNHRFKVPLNPQKTGRDREFGLGKFGVAVNGVPIEPAAAEYYQGQRDNWNYTALGGAIGLGFDKNYAHIQPTGLYHYHGVPTGLLQTLGWSKTSSPLVGYAADGFPIYVLAGRINGKMKMVKSSYRLKSGNRPGGRYPSGRHDGAFVEDYEYVAGSGDLDSCNGAMIKSAEYPGGTYAYFITREFPTVPRAFKGSPDQSFAARR